MYHSKKKKKAKCKERIKSKVKGTERWWQLTAGEASVAKCFLQGEVLMIACVKKERRRADSLSEAKLV